MADLEPLAAQVARVFARIEDEQMAGVPLLNPALRVQTLGFQTYEGRSMGVVTTPWMMSLLLFPSDQDNWSDLELGEKMPHKFPSGTRQFMCNDIDGIGVFQTHSLYSPMHQFHNQDQAVVVAESFLNTLMAPCEQPDLDTDDEEVLNRILRGEEPLHGDVDRFDAVEPGHALAEGQARGVTREQQAAKPITRRDLLRGNLRRDS
jgi:[NiFe] hydrogenase assembly HybE family chaperone